MASSKSLLKLATPLPTPWQILANPFVTYTDIDGSSAI
jgi:hypothetical protein